MLVSVLAMPGMLRMARMAVSTRSKASRVSVRERVPELAKRRNLGIEVELVPEAEAEDPKDLFCHTRSGATRAAIWRVA